MSYTEYYTMEADRRPHAARRSTVLNPASGRRLPVHVASVPATETAYFAMERRRRPAAAVRQGFVVKKPNLPVHVAFEANKLGAAAIETAYGAMEASRRPAAALRAGLRELDAPRHAVPIVNYKDTACAFMEAKRRPRAMARLAQHRGTAAPELSHPEMRNATPNNLHEQLDEFARWRTGAAVDELARLKLEARAPDEVNPFDSLERALAVQLDPIKSRGNSLRGASNFGRSTSSSSLKRLGSSGNLQRRNTPVSPKSNLLPRSVQCGFDPSIGEVVCRREDNGDVVFHGAETDVDAKLRDLHLAAETEA
jgi:hypothetical protein